MAQETLQFKDLSPYLLLKNGNYLYKVPFRGGWAVLKVYYGSRGRFSHIVKSLENVLLAGQTSYMPKTRLRVEQECLAIWRQHGFRVFNTYPDVEVVAPGCPPGGYLLFEYISKPKIGEFLRDEWRPLDERLAVFRRFLVEWSRRHDAAIAEREPRLVHENGDGKHVMILDDGGFLWFDFEMIFRRRAAVARHVSHEIIQYLWQITRSARPELQRRLLEETARHYPVRARLYAAHDYFFHHPNFFHRIGRRLQRAFSAKARRPDSKYSIARRLRAILDAPG
jgi:hypothetical protein